ncbi:hypothetical protein ACVV2G_12135 [Streptomyces ziwulingensis]
MHRTTTTATLLLTMAVSTLAGCTTVRGPASADPPAAGVHSSAPRPDGPAQPRVVQAPAREALEMTGPSRTPGHASGEPRRTAPPAALPRPTPPAARRERQPRPARPEAPKRPHPPSRPGAEMPAGPETPPRTDTGANADVCSLGKQYGGWRPGSPEAVICEQAYGH